MSLMNRTGWDNERGQTMSAADLVPELQAKIRDLEHGIEKRGNTIEVLQRRIVQLEAALDKFGVHGTWCARAGRVSQTKPEECTCGLDAARKGE